MSATASSRGGGGPVDGDGVETGAESSAPGLSGSIADGKANDGTEVLRGEMARLIAGAQYGPDMWSVPTDDDAAQIAGVVIEAGFRRVAGDDDLANRVGHAIQHTLAWVADQDYGKASDAWADVGRAAVRAISQSAPSSSQAGSSVRHVCCPHCTARTGSCVRCGVRDAEDDGQLCGQCDREVEAEVAGRAIRGGRDD